MMQRETVQVQYFPTKDQIADDLTKLLARTKFEYFRERLGMMPPSLRGRVDDCSFLRHSPDRTPLD
jgi:hypothetical protein